MPECPEINIFRENLSKAFDGQSLCLIEVVGGRFLKNPIPKLSTLQFPISNIEFKCKGKFIYWTTNNPDINLCFTLGMTGAFAPQSKHSALKFEFDNGIVFFNDPRRFGTFHIFDKNELTKKLSSLGWDILWDDIPVDVMSRVRKFSNKTVAELLMDQKIQSGIGNYLKAELCYAAKILPTRQVGTLNEEEIWSLYKAAKEITKISYSEGGATISTFADMNGNIGKFFDKFKIYGKKFDPLGNPVIKVETKDGRSSFYVKEIQK